MSRYEFKVGDRVRIRGWDDMRKEFGGTTTCINVPYSFTEDMRPLCGVAATIKEIYTKGVVELGDWDTNNDAACWTFTTGMLEPAFIAGRCYQLHDASDTRDGNIIKVAASSETRFSYETIRGEDNFDSAKNNSRFADCLVPLYGKQVGEAIRKWDAKERCKTKVREVKREAKVGETIKVVKAQNAPTYKNGDIFTVTGVSPTGGVLVEASDGGPAYLYDSEYAVLENYKVTDSKPKEVKREAKVGEYVKMIDTDDGYCKDDICKVIALYKGGDGDVFIRTKEMQDNYDATGADRPIKQPFSYAMLSEYVVLEGYKPEHKVKHSYDEYEIVDAKKCCSKMMVEFLDSCTNGGIDFIKNSNPAKTSCLITGDDGIKSGSAICSDHDEFNVWIGRYVALCKALKKPVPNFILEGGK